MLSELLGFPSWLLPVAFFFVCFVIPLFQKSRLPDVPIIGSRKGDWFPLLQARWRNTRDFKSALEAAFELNRPALTPVAGEGDLVVLPPSEVQFVIDQPDSVLGFNERAFEIYQIEHTFMDPTIARVALHENLLRTKLTPRIGSLVPDLVDEAARAFETHWGTSDEWREVCVFETMRHIVGSVANRAFVGLPYCRDPELVNNGMAFAVDLPISSGIIKLMWKPLRPFLSVFATIPNRIHTNRFRKILVGEIEKRLRKGDDEKTSLDPESAETKEREPNDFLQWSIQEAKASGNPYMLRPHTLADRLLVVNFAAIHTTSLTSTDALFDLLASRPEYLDALRDEGAAVLRRHGGRWDKRALAELVKLDSMLRESARVSPIVSTGLGRVVAAEAGVTTPSGVHLPRGTKISVPAYCIMRSEEAYTGAEEFQPFRFSDQRQRVEGGDQDDKDGGEENEDEDEDEKRKQQKRANHLRQARLALPTTTPDFLTFGHGRHACPGRFFAAAEIKVIMAYALLHYDFEMLPEKPEGSWVGVTRLPPLRATIKVRRRK